MRGRHGRLDVNRISALLVALVAVGAFAATFWFDPVPAGLPGLGAAEFPRLICLLLLGMAAMLSLQESPRRDTEAAPVTLGTWAIYAACLVFIPVMAGIGLLGAMAIFLVAAGRLWGETRWGMLLAVSLGFTLCIWLVFVKLFRLTLPGGLLFGA